MDLVVIAELNLFVYQEWLYALRVHILHVYVT